SGNKLTLRTKGLTTSPSLTVSTSAGDSARTQMAFAETTTVTDTLGSRFWIKDASVTGAASLSALDIDGLARLGFLGVKVNNGNGTISANFTANLVDPGTEAADGKITF